MTVPAATPRRPRIETLTPALMNRLDDAGRWARRAAIGMIAVGALLTLVACTMIGQPDFKAVFFFAVAAAFLLPSGYLFSYGRRVDRALDHEPALNIEFALAAARRFWAVLAVCSVVAVASLVVVALVPNFLSSMRGMKVRTTTARMAKFRDALEEYAVIHHSYPSAASMPALIKELQPAFGTGLEATDGWGTEMRYETVCGESFCWEYTLRSAGADRKFETPGDIALRNGEFLGAKQP